MLGEKCPLDFDRSSELIVGYGAGTLDLAATAAFELHIEFCAECREEAALQKAVWAALDECVRPSTS
jgi:anti-sigma factor ChrR (cupin superfamily)